MTAIYERPKEGDEIYIEPGSDIGIVCCDCKRVHNLHFELRDGWIYMVPSLDNRRTAALRRRFKKKLVE